MFALFGAGGQKICNMVDSRPAESAEIQKAKSWFDSKWNPVKVLGDEDYEKMLQEKLLYVNAEISIIDEHIEALRSQETEKKAGKANDKSS